MSNTLGDKAGNLLKDIIKNTFKCVIDLTPCLFKYRYYKILYLGSAVIGIIPIVKLGLEPRNWFIFTIPNFFIFTGILRTSLKIKHRDINRKLQELFKKDMQVVNSIDIEKSIDEFNKFVAIGKEEFILDKNKDQNIFKKIYYSILVIRKYSLESKEPIHNYMIRSSVPKSAFIKKRSDISHILDTNIISINQGKSKKIIIIKTCKDDIRGTDNRADEIQFLLNEMDFNVISVTEEQGDAMDIYKIKTTSEFEKINKKCSHIAFRLGIDKQKLYMLRDKGIAKLVISGTSKIYPFIDYIGLKEVRVTTKDMEVPMVAGIDLETNKLVCLDLAKFRHALVMGGTGSGKSCFINVLIQSAMYLTSNVAFLMFDFKIVELIQYSTFKNSNYINNHDDAVKAIDLLDEEMNSRLLRFANVGVKDLKSYNKKVDSKDKLPYLVVVIDEAADLSLEASDDKSAEKLNRKLNQIINKARVTGIVIIYSMQRADTNQIKSSVRAQLMTKIGFGTSDESERRFIGLDNLTSLAPGEMRIKYCGVARNIKCLFIDDNEIETNEVYMILKDKLSIQEVKNNA